ncbi:hypothetical protein ACLHDF_26010 [Priestia aryabhattai]
MFEKLKLRGQLIKAFRTAEIYGGETWRPHLLSVSENSSNR